MAESARVAAIKAHARVLDGEVALLDEFRLAIASNRWQHAVLGLAARSIQLQRAIHDGVVLGYADDELSPIARAMLSALVTLAHIGKGRGSRDREARALAWTLHQLEAQQRLHEYMWRSRRASKRSMDAETFAAKAAYDAMLAEASTRGVHPAARLGKSPTWTGLSDLRLFKRCGYLRFYRDYYALWSDEIHSGPTTLNQFLEQGLAGAFSIGPHQRNPWFILFAAGRFGCLVLGHLNAIYRLRRDSQIRKIFDEMQANFSRVLELSKAEAERESA